MIFKKLKILMNSHEVDVGSGQDFIFENKTFQEVTLLFAAKISDQYR
jgi:hypothetical protein